MVNNKIKPVKLNEYNERYGAKSMPFGWSEVEKGFQELYVTVYEAGGYGQIIRELEPELIEKVSKKPEKMDELDLAKLYLVGKSYLALGNHDAAIWCFKIIYSQTGFRKYILSNYHKYLDLAIDELEDLGRTLGYDKVNSLDIHEYLANMPKKKKGCFIATAVYGSPMAKEVSYLQSFRNEILLKSFLGRLFVSTYYFFSPPIAKIVSGSDFLRHIVRILIISPLLWITKQNLANKRNK